MDQAQESRVWNLPALAHLADQPATYPLVNPATQTVFVKIPDCSAAEAAVMADQPGASPNALPWKTS